MEKKACRQCERAESRAEPIRIGSRLKIAGLVFAAIFIVSFLPLFSSLNESLFFYLKLIWWAVLLGFIAGGLIDYFVPEGFIYGYLGRKRKRSIFYAVIAGFLLSACSHGILAISIQLFKKGAGIPSVIAFLLASPWANLPVTILLFRFFGWKALLFIFSAMLVALITGLVYMLLEKEGLIEKSKEVAIEQSYSWDRIKNFNLRESLGRTLAGSVSLANMVLWWIMIGFLSAAIIRAYVPEQIFHQYLGPSFLGLLATLAFATVIEICSEGSSPIAFEIFNKVGVLGNPFVFLMAGVATDYTEIGLLWTNIGKRTALWLPVVTVPQILLLGFLFNAVIK